MIPSLRPPQSPIIGPPSLEASSPLKVLVYDDWILDVPHKGCISWLSYVNPDSLPYSRMWNEVHRSLVAWWCIARPSTTYPHRGSLCLDLVGLLYSLCMLLWLFHHVCCCLLTCSVSRGSWPSLVTTIITGSVSICGYENSGTDISAPDLLNIYIYTHTQEWNH